MTGLDILSACRCAADVVRHYARVTPQRPAVVFHETRLSYGDLDREVDRAARALVSLGLGLGDRMAILSTPRPEFLTTLLACNRLGVIWLGLNPKYTARELTGIVTDFEPDVLFGLVAATVADDAVPLLSQLRGTLPKCRATVAFGEGRLDGVEDFDAFLRRGDQLSEEAFARAQAGREADQPAIVVYTSGSTGRPKGALLGSDAFFHCYRAVMESFAGRLELRRDLVTICNLPINHVGCVFEICFNTLADGGCLVFMESFRPAEIPAVIERERVSLYGGVPAMLQAQLEEPSWHAADLSSLKIIAWGGAAMPRPLLERLKALGVFLFTNYGLTEGGSVNTATRPDAGFEDLLETVGFPDHDLEYRLVSPDNQAVAVGGRGEVQMRGRALFKGYWRAPQATADAFTGDGWFRTGDIMSVRADGAWTFAGRMREMFKSGGYNVYPREIEIVLEDHPAVAAAAVVAVADPKYSEVGVAFIQPRQGETLDLTALKAHCVANLANYKIPKSFRFMSALPLLPIGKIDKLALGRLAARPSEPGEGGTGTIQLTKI